MLDLIIIKSSEAYEIKSMYDHSFADLFSSGDSKYYQSMMTFLEKWHKDEIPGKKFTLCLFEEEMMIGALRLWSTPYLEGKWLIEGLEVDLENRQKGYGKLLVNKAVETLAPFKLDTLYVNINQKNTASINTHLSVGFKLLTAGCLNSYGDFKSDQNQYVYYY